MLGSLTGQMSTKFFKKKNHLRNSHTLLQDNFKETIFLTPKQHKTSYQITCRNCEMPSLESEVGSCAKDIFLS